MKKKIKEDKRRKQGKSRHIILFICFRYSCCPSFWYAVFSDFVFMSFCPVLWNRSFRWEAGCGRYGENECEIGEIVTFQKSGRTVTHRVTGLKEHGYQTKGDANQEADYDLLQQEQIVGTVVFCILIWDTGYFGCRNTESLLSVEESPF